MTLTQSKHLQVIAILMMLCLHLFNRDYHGLFQPLIFIGNQPLSYYISLFSDACVPIFAFVSGYGLYYKYQQINKSTNQYLTDNLQRLKKLYLNYWVVLFIFAIGLGWLLGKDGYPGNLWRFLENFSGLQGSYNGAWWYFTTYVFFILTSSFWFRLLDKLNPYLLFAVLLVAYFVGFYFRIYKTNIFSQSILQYFHRQTALYFCTLFQFMLGAFVLKYNWNSKVDFLFQKIHYKNTLVVAMMIGLVIVHAVFPNLIFAPFTALAFIFLFIQLKIPKFLDKALSFLAPHSTNMWLIHMFFYMIYFPEFVYSFKYPILIFLVLVTMCVVSSFVVIFLIRKIEKIRPMKK